MTLIQFLVEHSTNIRSIECSRDIPLVRIRELLPTDQQLLPTDHASACTSHMFESALIKNVGV